MQYFTDGSVFMLREPSQEDSISDIDRPIMARLRGYNALKIGSLTELNATVTFVASLIDIPDEDRTRIDAVTLLQSRITELLEQAPTRFDPPNDESSAAYSGIDPIGHELLCGLLVAHNYWHNAVFDTTLELVLALRSDTPQEGAGVILGTPSPTVIIQPGSLAITIGTIATIAAAKDTARWVISLYRKRAAARQTADDAADALVAALRHNARKTAQAGLFRLGKDRCGQFHDETVVQAARKAKTIVVCLHGIFGTDLGTFDGILTTWEIAFPALKAKGFLERYTTPSDVCFIGWPHNSLTEIRLNAEDLATDLEDLFNNIDSHSSSAKPLPNIAFLCHSRGGLVARAAFCTLAARKEEIATRIVAALTYGTPHLGAPFEAPSAFHHAGVVSMMLLGTAELASVDAVLAYIEHNRVIHGLRNLFHAPGNKDTFLARLEQHEFHFGRLPIFAVGGALDPATLERTSWSGWIKTKLISFTMSVTGPQIGDGIVPVSSSIPQWSEHRHIVERDHFDYFRVIESDLCETQFYAFLEMLSEIARTSDERYPSMYEEVERKINQLEHAETPEEENRHIKDIVDFVESKKSEARRVWQEYNSDMKQLTLKDAQ